MTAAVAEKNGKVLTMPVEEAHDQNDDSYVLGGAHTARVVKLIDAAHRAGITPILWGKPGVGKTALVEALSKRPGFGGLVRVLTGSQDKSDTLGMPSRATYIAADGTEINTTEHATPHWALWANDQQGTVYVFLDELPQADTDVQGTFLTVLQNYVMPSGVKIKPHVKFIAAGNPTDVVASGYELIEPLQNRLSHMTYEPPKEEWFEGMLDAWGKSVSNDEMVLRRYIVGYLMGHGNLLHNPPQSGSTENAWPSRRSWDNLARMGAGLMSDKDILEHAAETLVGKAAASDFVTAVFRINAKTPDEVVADPSCVDWTNSFSGFMGLSGVVSWLNDPKDAEAVIDVFNFAVKNGPKDVAVTWLKPLFARINTIGGDRKLVSRLDLTANGFRDYLPLIYKSFGKDGSE